MYVVAMTEWLEMPTSKYFAFHHNRFELSLHHIWKGHCLLVDALSLLPGMLVPNEWTTKGL